MFTEVPRTYKLLNHLLTFGQHIFWRRRAARVAAAGAGTLGSGTILYSPCPSKNTAGKQEEVLFTDWTINSVIR